MIVEIDKQPIEQIKKLRQYLPESTNEELEQILKYGEEKREQGARKKKEFWSRYGRDDFKKLLWYMGNNLNELIGKYRYLDRMNDMERKKIIEEYLYNDMLYSVELLKNVKKIQVCRYKYNQWMSGGVVLKKLDILDLSDNKIGDEGVDAIMKKLILEEGMTLRLNMNGLGPDGAKVIAENIELKEGVLLDLSHNEFGDEGAEALSHIELKEGVELDLSCNNIGAEGAEAIAKMKLKNGVSLIFNTYYTASNPIGIKGLEAFSKMELQEGVSLFLPGMGIGDAGMKLIAKNIKLKKGVSLKLDNNEIGNEGMKSIAENLELQEGVKLDLAYNKIGYEGLEYMMNNMKLKDGVVLDLRGNDILPAMKKKLKRWVKSYKSDGINCKIILETGFKEKWL